MAKTIEQMNKWSYKKAFKYFTESDRDRIILDAQNYIASLNKMVPLVDFRKEKDASMAINKIKGSIGKNTLVLIDGASANGKTTFAERLASKIDAEIVDVDKLCTNYLRNIMLGPATILEKKRGAANMGQDITDEYILNNLEWIIEEKSKGNRPVILIGMYLDEDSEIKFNNYGFAEMNYGLLTTDGQVIVLDGIEQIYDEYYTLPESNKKKDEVCNTTV